MKLFLLTRESAVGEVRSIVVRAPTTEAARRLASAKAGPEGKDAWLHINKSTCTELADGGEAGVVVVVT